MLGLLRNQLRRMPGVQGNCDGQGRGLEQGLAPLLLTGSGRPNRLSQGGLAAAGVQE